MSPIVRRIVYVALFETIGILFVSVGLALFSGQNVAQTGGLAVATSLIAVSWNFVFNSLFESWEARQKVRGRSVLRRAAHALGFELGLVALIVPLLAWWMEVSLGEAFLYDFALVLFFVAYAFLFNLAFDLTFGLPASARP